MNPIAAGVAGALISGVAMYTVGAKTAQVDAFTPAPALVQTADGQYLAVSNATALRPAAPTLVPVRNTTRAAAPRRTVYRPAQVQEEREIVREEDVRRERTWGKTAMIGIMGGKKGALIGAAIGGGAASIYEATQRR
jgi:hypothetical protein